MTTVRNGAWWESFVERLRSEPLAALATELEADPAELERSLVLADPGGSATDAPWWPEAARSVQAGASLRATARRFGTNPRRLRRGLARAGLRVRGRDVSEGGVPELAAHQDQLGLVPDGELAEAAGVTVEAVQGERRRRGIAGFRPPPAARPAPPPEARRAPKRRRRDRAPEEPAEPQVIRGLPPRRARSRSTPAPLPATMTGGLPTLPSRPKEPAPPEKGKRRRRLVRPDPRDDSGDA